MGSKSDVSAFFRLRFGNCLGAKPAGVLPFACAPQTPFSCVWPGGLQASKSYVALCLAWGNLSQPFFFVFSRFQKQRFGRFLAAVSLGWALYFFFLFSGFQKRRFGIFLSAKPAGVLLFRVTPFSWVWPGGLQVFSLFLLGSKSNVSAVFWLRFRIGIFLLSAFFVGSKSNVSAVFWLRFRMVWQIFIILSFFLMGSNSDVSAFFRLRFRNGLGTKPAGVLPFRMRVPNTFFLSLAWWLARLKKKVLREKAEPQQVLQTEKCRNVAFGTH